MKILLIGAQGQLGSELRKKLNLYNLLCPTKEELDLSKKITIKQFLKIEMPDIIINSGAYTKVDLAETDRKKAKQINSEALIPIAEYSKKYNKKIIHFSTDYIFDGMKNEPYVEDDLPNPINFYGITKNDGEQNIINNTENYLIFRISWVYGLSGSNFPKKIIELSKIKNSIEVIHDQIGVPSSAKFIAEIVKSIIEKHDNTMVGIFNLCPNGYCSWHEFAVEIIKQMSERNHLLKTSTKDILPVSSSKFFTPAKRPKNSVLNNGKIKKRINVDFSDWKLYLTDFMNEYEKG